MTISRGHDASPSHAYDNSALVELSGVATHVQTWSPRGEPRATVVGLHHFYGSAQTFHRLGPLLAASGVRLVAFDRVGFGLTDRPAPDGRWTGPTSPYTRAFAAGQVVALLDHLGEQRAVVTGTSMGGTIALELALAHPGRVAHVVPCSAPLTADASVSPWLRRVLRTPAFSRLGPAVVRRMARDIDRDRVARSWHDPGRVEGTDVDAHGRFRHVPGWDRSLWWKFVADSPPDLRRRLPGLAGGPVGVTAVGATHDRLVPPWVARHVATVTGGDHVEIACGHVVHAEGAQQLADVLAEVVG